MRCGRVGGCARKRPSAKPGIKMLFPVVLFILPALFVITLVPGVLSVLRDLRGGIGAR